MDVDALSNPVNEPAADHATPQPLTLKPDFSGKSKFKTAPKTTVKLTDLLKVEPKKEQTASAEVKRDLREAYTPEQLQQVWNSFAEQRKKFQAEYQLLSQPFTLRENYIVVALHNPVQEMMLTNLKSELSAYVREQLRNDSIIVIGEFQEAEERKVIYTNREKFDYLVSKNPMLRELKDRLGLDTDF